MSALEINFVAERKKEVLVHLELLSEPTNNKHKKLTNTCSSRYLKEERKLIAMCNIEFLTQKNLYFAVRQDSCRSFQYPIFVPSLANNARWMVLTPPTIKA